MINFIILYRPTRPTLPHPAQTRNWLFGTVGRSGSMNFGVTRYLWKFAMLCDNRMRFHGSRARRCHIIRSIPVTGKNAAGDGEQGKIGQEASESFHKRFCVHWLRRKWHWLRLNHCPLPASSPWGVHLTQPAQSAACRPAVEHGGYGVLSIGPRHLPHDRIRDTGCGLSFTDGHDFSYTLNMFATVGSGKYFLPGVPSSFCRHFGSGTL